MSCRDHLTIERPSCGSMCPRPEPVFVDLSRNQGIDYQPVGPVRQAYLTSRPAKIYTGWRNRFLDFLKENVHNYHNAANWESNYSAPSQTLLQAPSLGWNSFMTTGSGYTSVIFVLQCCNDVCFLTQAIRRYFFLNLKIQLDFLWVPWLFSQLFSCLLFCKVVHIFYLLLGNCGITTNWFQKCLLKHAFIVMCRFQDADEI